MQPALEVRPAREVRHETHVLESQPQLAGRVPQGIVYGVLHRHEVEGGFWADDMECDGSGGEVYPGGVREKDWRFLVEMGDTEGSV